MIKNTKNAYYLFEGMLNEGLPFVANYLKRKIGQPVIITDAVGNINYPDQGEEFYIDIPEFTQKYYYVLAINCLYYPIRDNSTLAYVIIENLPEDMLDESLAVISESNLALTYHFSLSIRKKEDFGQSLWENFFSKSCTSIPEKLKLFEQSANIDNFYFVSVLEAEENPQGIDWKSLQAYTYETMHQDRSECITSIIAPNRLITILRGYPEGGPMDINPDWPGRKTIETTQKFIADKFNLSCSLGFGRVYKPSGLLKSYQEACIALTLPRLMGERQFIQFFSNLGVFVPIFSNDIDTIKNYCLQVLGKVIEHDEKYGTDFIGTLRILLDNACSWTTTATKLYVHVNTVHYRMFKIEKLLNVDFSLFQTRLHLYTAIKTWDTLQMCNLLE